MRAPRRVPWATRAELDELYDLVFSPDADEAMKMRGLERMSVYISSPSCPAFMPILYGLVSADLLPAPRNVVEAQSTRLSCAMAIVRLVNGMVDPLQTGPYARPISHLAATLHIPPALIALRHRATHEDLPPLPLLRASVIQCISYLHTYSFLPLLAESSTAQLHPASAGAADAAGNRYHKDDRASQLVARYKRTSKDKARDRDVDESGARAKDLRRIQRGLEVEDTRDVVRALCSTEGLVPVARKKRPKVMTEVEPTEGSVKLWGPLLRHLAPYHPTLADVLAQHIVRVLLEPVTGTATGTVPVMGREDVGAGGKEDIKEQTSYRWALAVWLIYMWSPSSRPRAFDMQLGREEKKAVWGSLLPVLVPGTPILRRLASCLAEADPSIASGWFQLESMLPTAPQDAHSAAVAGRSGGNDGLSGLEIPGDIDMAVFGADGRGPVMPGAPEEEVAGTGVLDDAFERMQARMAQFEQMMSGGRTSSTGSEAEADTDGTNGTGGKDMDAAPGWRRLTLREWKPCPVGMSGLA